MARQSNNLFLHAEMQMALVYVLNPHLWHNNVQSTQCARRSDHPYIPRRLATLIYPQDLATWVGGGIWIG